jgi:hypothetical protein
MKSRMRWVEDIVHIGYRTGANGIWWKTLRDRDHLEKLGSYGRITLKCIFWLIHIIYMTPGQKSGKKLTNEKPNGFIAHQVNMGLHRRRIIAMYWYTVPQSIVFGSITLPTDSSQFILMWFHIVCKINKAAPAKACYQSCTKFRTLVEHAKKFSGIITHYFNSSVWRTA